jgi:hypothetical protein
LGCIYHHVGIDWEAMSLDAYITTVSIDWKKNFIGMYISPRLV